MKKTIEALMLSSMETHVAAVELAILLLTNPPSKENYNRAMKLLREDLDAAKIMLASEQRRLNPTSQH